MTSYGPALPMFLDSSLCEKCFWPPGARPGSGEFISEEKLLTKKWQANQPIFENNKLSKFAV